MTQTGWKLLKDSTHVERAWHEDAGYENGNYVNTCVHCGRSFQGHKRRVICKVCHSNPEEPKSEDTALLDWLSNQPWCDIIKLGKEVEVTADDVTGDGKTLREAIINARSQHG